MKRVLIIILLILITAIPVAAQVCPDNHFMKYTVTKEPTYTEEGEQIGICALCGYEESMTLPMLSLPDVSFSIKDSTITLTNLYGVKDIFFAGGQHTSYREVKNNLVYGITNSKLGNSTTYSYTFRDKGMHTVYIRFGDTRADKIFRININAAEPKFTYGNGKLTVGNIEDAKVIRVAEGEHDSVNSMKSSGTIRNYTGRILKADSYTLKFAANGIYTVAVEYTTGYVKIHKCVIYGKL